ncbi:MAG: hypothetical protein KDC46_04980 [Thermoleophilia bacterium]|nr:hypothetical protein [Thermoleophilia bacterium]
MAVDIPATGRIPSAAIYDAMDTTAWIANLESRGVRNQDLLDMVAVFDVTDGRLVAANDVAEAVRQSAEGARMIERIEAALAVDPTRVTIREVLVVDPTQGGRRRRTTQGSRDAIAATALATSIASYSEFFGDMGRSERASYLDELRRGTAGAKKSVQMMVGTQFDSAMDAAVIGTDRLVIAQRVSKVLGSPDATMRGYGTRYAAEVLAHEFEHAVTPADANSRSGQELAWLEEGGADTLARWPGVAKRYTDAMGLAQPIAAPRLDARNDYDRMTAVVRRLLVLAGVDVTRADQLDAARALLQDGPLEQAPRRLARAIHARHPHGEQTVAELERDIRRLDGSLAAIRRLERALGA